MFRTHDSFDLSDMAIGGQSEKRKSERKDDLVMSQSLFASENTSWLNTSCDFSVGDMFEELSIRDVIRATVYDFNRTARKLRKNRTNVHYLQHLLDLIVFIRQDDSFIFMEPDRETFISLNLSNLGLTVSDLLNGIGKGRKENFR